MGFFRAAGLVALLQIVLAAAAFSQDVTLKSRDGTVEISGTLLSFDGEFYRVDSEYGVLTVDGSGVICSGPGCPDLEAYVARLRFSGAQGAGNALVVSLIEAFARNEGYGLRREVMSAAAQDFTLIDESTGRRVAEISLRLGSSEEGFADLLAREADLAVSTRPARPEEVSRGLEAELGNLASAAQARVLALDALVPVVSRRNPVPRISLEDLVRVFSGEIDNWRQLGGLDAPIVLHALAADRGEAEVMATRFFGPAGGAIASGIQRHASGAELAQAVARDPFAIGVTTLSQSGETKILPLVDGCGFRGEATRGALRTEDYPLVAPVFLYLTKTRLPAVGREFLRFLRTPAARIAVRRAGFVDQAFSRTPLKQQGDRLANAIRAAGEEVPLRELQRLVEALTGWQRLSVAFRFEGGSAELDPQSTANVISLARALEAGTLGADELLFAGFTDGEGPAEANRRLSRKRAISVRNAVIAAATTIDPSRLRLRVEGFGEAMPMACDDTDWGRGVNRRVEVWVR
jgi:phosphate transport system substrate-binding protein